MAMQTGVGKSASKDSFLAGKESCQKALAKLKNKADFLLVFTSAFFDQKEVTKGIQSVSKNAKMIGCSTSGEITNEGVAKNSVVVLAIQTDNINFVTAVGGDIKVGAEQAGQVLAENLVKNGKNINSLIMLTDVLVGNGAAVVRGIQKVLGKKFLIIGGAAGDDFQFKQTFEFCDGQVFSGTVVGVGLSGDFVKGVGVKHGWDSIGLPMKVTKSEGTVLKELDGKPAISIYEDYFGAKAKDLRKEPLARMAITYPLGMAVAGSDELLIRDPITVDENGWITCAAEIPQDSDVRLMIGSKEKAIKAAKEAAKCALSQLKGKKPKAIILFNCIARQKLFGRNANKEIEAIKEVLGKDVPLIGFYTYGEQAPLGGDMKKCFSCFHNETDVILVLGE